MVRSWLTGVGVLLGLGFAGCGESDSSSDGNVQIVATDDGTVEVVAAGRVLFALAPIGPVARNFRQPTGQRRMVRLHRSFRLC